MFSKFDQHFDSSVAFNMSSGMVFIFVVFLSCSDIKASLMSSLIFNEI